MADVTKAARELGRKGGSARASRMTTEQRRDSATAAARKRWDKARASPCAACGEPLGPGKLLRVYRGMVHAECRVSCDACGAAWQCKSDGGWVRLYQGFAACVCFWDGAPVVKTKEAR